MVNGKKPLKLAIIIPAYNEQRHLARCLDSIAAQSEKPDEVIVVDNNSHDRTVEIAKKYHFVKVAREKDQGVIPARNRGFDEAKADILARINADVALNSGWVARVKEIFRDPTVGGVSGPASTRLFFRVPLRTTVWSKGYLIVTKAFFRVGILWGANMAIRDRVWKEIKSDTSREDSYVHEDQDLSVLVASRGYFVIQDKKLTVSTDEISYFYWPKFREYMIRRWRTKRYHVMAGTYYRPKMRRLSLIWSVSILIILFIPWSLFGLASLISYLTNPNWLEQA